jgi:hypothetical protein
MHLVAAAQSFDGKRRLAAAAVGAEHGHGSSAAGGSGGAEGRVGGRVDGRVDWRAKRRMLLDAHGGVWELG